MTDYVHPQLMSFGIERMAVTVTDVNQMEQTGDAIPI